MGRAGGERFDAGGAGGPATELADGCVALGAVDLSAGDVTAQVIKSLGANALFLRVDGVTKLLLGTDETDISSNAVKVASLWHDAGVAIGIGADAGSVVSKLAVDAGTVEVQDELLVSDALRLAAEAEKVANYTATASDALLVMNGANLDLTLPAAPGANQHIWVYNRHATILDIFLDAGDAESPGTKLTELAPSSGCLLWFQAGASWRVVNRSIPNRLHANTVALGGTDLSAGQVLIGSGTVGAPGLAFSADPDTGLALISAAFSQVFGGASVSEYVAGVQRMVNSSQLQLADGAVGTPAVAFVADPDSGLFRATNNRLDFATAGALRAQITTLALQTNNNMSLRMQGNLAAEAEAVKTGNYTIASSDVIVISNGATLTHDLPATPATDQVLLIINIAATAVTVARNGNQINGAAANDNLPANTARWYIWNGTSWYAK